MAYKQTCRTHVTAPHNAEHSMRESSRGELTPQKEEQPRATLSSKQCCEAWRCSTAVNGALQH